MIRWTMVTVVTCIVVALTAPAAVAGDSKDGKKKNEPEPDQTFLHKTYNRDMTFTIEKSNGDPIRILITETMPDLFTYKITGLEVVAEKPRSQAALAGGDATGEALVEQRHDKRYGGYVIRIRKKKADADTKGLNEVNIFVTVVTKEWNVEFAGAFSVNGLTDPQYALEEDTTAGDLVVIRDYGAQDDVALGIAAFIDVGHTKVPYLAGTFGLGINEGAKATYYFGVSGKAGVAALTIGGVVGQVARLPTGVSEGSHTDNPNLLVDLPSETKVSWFIAVSFTFLGSRDAFDKPFMGSSQAQTDAK